MNVSNKINVNKDDNISFTFKEKTEEKDNSVEIEKMLYELENDDELEEFNLSNNQPNTEAVNKISYYFFTKKLCEEKYGINNDIFYSDYTVKELLKICNYYDIEKYVKTSKCKKQDIISSIVYFESLPENVEVVNRRHTMWSHMTELVSDPKMKKYVIW